jgi:uncharacterized membrane protein YfcA
MLDWITTFLSLFFTDIFYTYYLKAVQKNEAIKASIWAVVVFCVACVAVINYTTNHVLLVPAALGAFLGTYVGIKLRNETKDR